MVMKKQPPGQIGINVVERIIIDASTSRGIFNLECDAELKTRAVYSTFV
jgi:hypothetical protein